ncbi:hypothetical protein AB0H12_35085 [Actinosynnema sp. NPDC023794]
MFLAANAPLTALLVPFGMTVWGGEGSVGLVMSALGVGFLLGAPAGPAPAELTSPRTTAYAACAVTVAAAEYAASTPSVHQPFAP